MKKHIVLYVVFGMCTLYGITPGKSFAQERAEQADENTTLDTVVVTASRIAEKSSQVTASMTVISQEEIAKHQYQDVGGLLRNYGIQVDNYQQNGGLSQIAIRGVRSSAMGSDLQGSILILVDGRRVGTDNIAMVPLVNVDHIEIIRGPAAVQYGTSAMGGVINILTKRGSEVLSASLEAGGGSWKNVRSQAEVSGGKGPVDFSGGVSYLSADSYSTGGHQRYPNTGLGSKIAYSANAGFTFLEEHRLGFTVLGVDADDMGSPNYINDLRRHEYTNRRNYSVDASYEGGYKTSGLSWKGRYFTGKNSYRNDEHGGEPFANFYKSATEYQGAQGQTSFANSWLTVTGGVDWLHYKTKAEGEWYPVPEISTYDNTGLFLLSKFTLFEDKVILSGGVRHDEYTLKVNEGDGKKRLRRNTPSAGIAWNPTKWLTLRSSYGESYRIPDAVALVGFKGMFTYVGNPNLKPEEGKTIDAGLEVNHKALHLGLTYFQTDYKNKISLGFTPSFDGQYYNEDGKIRLRGFEGNASYDIGAAFDWPFVVRPYVNFTAITERKDAEGETVLNVSDLDLAYGLNFSHPDIGFTADVRVTRYGQQYVRDFNMASSTQGQVVSIGNTTIADLFLTQRIYESEKSGKLSVNAEVRNIFDKKYELVKDYPQPGRSFYLGLRYEF